MKNIASVLILCVTIFLLNQTATRAQENRWQFISRNDNGSTSYLEKSNKSETGDRKQTWTKEVYSDGSYKITLVDWQCREKRFRVLEAANYMPSGEYIDKEGSSAWSTIVPDSVSENYYQVICSASGQKSAAKSIPSGRKIIARIIALNANIRESPTAESRVLQRVEKGTYLFLADTEPTNGWYQVFIPDTNEAGWLYGNTIELLVSKPHARQPRQTSKPMTGKRGGRAN